MLSKYPEEWLRGLWTAIANFTKFNCYSLSFCGKIHQVGWKLLPHAINGRFQNVKPLKTSKNKKFINTRRHTFRESPSSNIQTTTHMCLPLIVNFPPDMCCFVHSLVFPRSNSPKNQPRCSRRKNSFSLDWQKLIPCFVRQAEQRQDTELMIALIFFFFCLLVDINLSPIFASVFLCVKEVCKVRWEALAILTVVDGDPVGA